MFQLTRATACLQRQTPCLPAFFESQHQGRALYMSEHLVFMMGEVRGPFPDRSDNMPRTTCGLSRTAKAAYRMFAIASASPPTQSVYCKTFTF